MRGRRRLWRAVRKNAASKNKTERKKERKRGVRNVDETEKRGRSKYMYYKRIETDTRIYIYKRRSDKRSRKDGADRVNK